MKQTDIQLDDTTMDIFFKNGDIAMGDTLRQNEYLLLISNKGEWKQDPLVGVGISDMLNDNDILSWKRKIREGLKADGLNVSTLDIDRNTGEIKTIEATYA